MARRRIWWGLALALAALVAGALLRPADDAGSPDRGHDVRPADTAGVAARRDDGGAPRAERARARPTTSEAAAAGGDGADDAEESLGAEVRAGPIAGHAWAAADRAVPLPGVLVRVFPEERGETESPLLLDLGASREVARATTDAEGAFRVDVGAGLWRVVATADGRASAGDTFRAGSAEVSLVLPEVRAWTVTVVDAMGAPVAGAELRVGSAETDAPPHAVVRTGGDGRAEVPTREGGAIVVRAGGFATRQVVWDGDRPPERIELRRGLPAAGVVTDASAKPIAGAAVATESDDAPRRIVVTGPDGRFAFDGTAGGALRVSADGFVERRVDLVPGDVELRVVLSRRVVVDGVVVWPPAVRRSGLRITAGAAGATFHEPDRFVVVVPEGPVRIEARAEEAGPHGTPLVGSADVVARPEGPSEDVRVVLAPPDDLSFLEVEVPEAAGPPERKARVFAMREGENVGRVEFQGASPRVLPLRVPPGTEVELRGYLEDGTAVQKTLVVPSVRTGRALPYPRVALPSVTGPALRVRLVEGGRERPDLMDRLSVAGRPAGPGRWTMSPFAPGLRITFAAEGWASYEVNYVAPGWDSWRDWFARGEMPEFELTIPLRRPATLRARLARPDGSAVAGRGSWLLAVRTDVSLDHHLAGPLAPGGGLLVAALPPGRATLDLWPPAVRPIRRELDIEEGATIDLGDVVVAEPPHRWCDGVATDLSARPLGGVAIRPELADGSAAGEPSWSAPDGAWRVRAPDVAGLRFACTKAGYGRTAVAAAPDAGRTRVALPRGGSVLVRVQRRPAIGHLTWFLRTPGADERYDTPTRPASPPADGRPDWRSWVYDDVAPGPVEVVLRTAKGDLVRRVDVVAGGTVEAVFDDATK